MREGAGDEGTNTLVNIELLRFAGGDVPMADMETTTLSGRVTDRTGTPLVDTDVIFDGDPPTPLRASSGPDGIFALDSLRTAVGLQNDFAPRWVFLDVGADLSNIDRTKPHSKPASASIRSCLVRPNST